MSELDFAKGGGLVPAIIQDEQTDEVYMLGYMDKAALDRTKESGWVHFFSRSKNRIWMKGEESGNKLRVISIFEDCDSDTLLVKVQLHGEAVCHTGHKSCFYRKLNMEETS